MKRTLLRALPALLAGAALAGAGCGSLATPEAPSTGSPASAGAVASVSQQVKDGGQLYVDLACVRCHAPNGSGGVPNRLNVGGDSTIPPLNNQFRDESEQFRAAPAITQILRRAASSARSPA